jgi:hypothetical protein
VTRQLGGHVDIESHVGIGTTMRIYFPRAADGVKRQTADNAFEQLPSSDASSALVVDDVRRKIKFHRPAARHSATSFADRPQGAIETAADVRVGSNFALLLGE